MLTKFRANMSLLMHPAVIMALRVLILVICFILAAFVNTHVVLAEPGWGGVGG